VTSTVKGMMFSQAVHVEERIVEMLSMRCSRSRPSLGISSFSAVIHSNDLSQAERNFPREPRSTRSNRRELFLDYFYFYNK
jgi:hypothetical protein